MCCIYIVGSVLQWKNRLVLAKADELILLRWATMDVNNFLIKREKINISNIIFQN